MEIDKKTIGLSIILAVVVAVTMFSAFLPVIGDTAVQNATVTKNTTTVQIVSQYGNTTNDVTQWNFSGQSGATVDNPTNSLTETQNTGTDQKAVACLNNTNAVNMTVYITAGTWTPSNTISSESFNVSDGTTPDGWTDFTLGSEVQLNATNAPAANLSSNGNWSLWLKVGLGVEGAATSTFNVTSET